MKNRTYRTHFTSAVSANLGGISPVARITYTVLVETLNPAQSIRRDFGALLPSPEKNFGRDAIPHSLGALLALSSLFFFCF